MVNKAIKKLFSLLSFVMISYMANAQVYIQEEPAIATLMESYESQNQQRPMIKAWRIQIITTNDRRVMEKAIYKLKNKYPGTDYDMEHVSPYYKVKIGGFETKRHLAPVLAKIKKDFPRAIPVMDNIEKANLVNP